jgi:hypothetical protein
MSPTVPGVPPHFSVASPRGPLRTSTHRLAPSISPRSLIATGPTSGTGPRADSSLASRRSNLHLPRPLRLSCYLESVARVMTASTPRIDSLTRRRVVAPCGCMQAKSFAEVPGPWRVARPCSPGFSGLDVGPALCLEIGKCRNASADILYARYEL